MGYMASDKPITKKDLVDSLQVALKNLSTKKNVFEMISQSNEAVLKGVEKMVVDLRGELHKVRDELKAGQRDLQRQITDLNKDTPTQKEFDQLQDKVYQHHPAN